MTVVRTHIDDLDDILISAPDGMHIPLADLADIRVAEAVVVKSKMRG